MNNTIRKRNLSPIILFALIISLNSGCGTQSFGQRADSLFLFTDDSEIFYHIKKPDEKHFLPYVLAEISGLTFKSPNNLLAIDDETGKVFEYDVKERKIVHSMEFYKPGDYEGVELVNNEVLVLESDGDIYRFGYGEEKKLTSKKFETALERKNDTEGLGYDPISNQLLIVCKEKGSVNTADVKGRAVYVYDLNDNQLDDQPIFSIRSKDLEAFWEEKKAQKYESDRIKFKPSAIAYHPIEKVYYILASVGKLLVVVRKDGSIKATYPIPPRVLSQPEGICFNLNGDMYISSEGEGDRGYVLKFSMQRK